MHNNFRLFLLPLIFYSYVQIFSAARIVEPEADNSSNQIQIDISIQIDNFKKHIYSCTEFIKKLDARLNKTDLIDLNADEAIFMMNELKIDQELLATFLSMFNVESKAQTLEDLKKIIIDKKNELIKDLKELENTLSELVAINLNDEDETALPEITLDINDELKEHRELKELSTFKIDSLQKQIKQHTADIIGYESDMSDLPSQLEKVVKDINEITTHEELKKYFEKKLKSEEVTKSPMASALYVTYSSFESIIGLTLDTQKDMMINMLSQKIENLILTVNQFVEKKRKRISELEKVYMREVAKYNFINESILALEQKLKTSSSSSKDKNKCEDSSEPTVVNPKIVKATEGKEGKEELKK